MKSTALSSACFALAMLPGVWAQEPGAATVLRKTAENYANLTSTSFQATTVLIDENQRDGMTMEVAFRRPDKARLLVKGTGVGQAFGVPANEVLIVVDGLYTWMSAPGWKQYTRVAGGLIRKESEPAAQPGAAAGFVSHMVESIDALVRQYAGAADKMKLAGEDTVRGVECYVVESKSRKPLKRLWIDKARYVLVQEETTTKEGAVLRTSFSGMVLNQPLPDDLFAFMPGAGDVLVETITAPDSRR